MVRKMNAARAEHHEEAEAGAELQSRRQFLSSEAHGRLAVESPARRLQLQLHETLLKPDPQRWSARRSLAIVFVSNAVLWAAVIAAVRALF